MMAKPMKTLELHYPMIQFLIISFIHIPCSAYYLHRGIHADVIVYIFAHLHTALRIEGNMLDMNLLQAAKVVVKLNTW